MNSVQQQHEHHHWKILVENFSFEWSGFADSLGFRSFGLVKLASGSERVKQMRMTVHAMLGSNTNPSS